jgi:putative transposase
MSFQSFSKAVLASFFDLHALPAEGREYIEKALTGPSRKIQGGTRNATSNNPCPKMGTSFSVESDTAEARALLDYIFDPDVLAYSAQAPKLPLDYIKPDGKHVRTTTPPDFMVLRKSKGLCLNEWKPASKKDRLTDSHPGRYVSDSGRVSSPCAEEAARRLGATYSVRFDDEIPCIRTLNQRWLISYLTRKAAQTYERTSTLVTSYFCTNAYCTLDELLEQEGVDLDLVHWCLANGWIAFEWDTCELARTQNYLLFRDQDALRAHQIATGDIACLRKENAFPSLPLVPSAISPGSTIIADGVNYKVQFVGNTSIVGVGQNGELFEAPWRLLSHLNNRGLLTIKPRSRNEPEDRQLNLLRNATTEQIRGALKRREALEQYRSGVPIEQIPNASLRSISRWSANEREATAAGLPPIAGLIDQAPLRGFHGPHIDVTLSEKIDTAIEKGLAQKIRPSLHQIFHSIKKEIENNGEKMISLPAFYARAKKQESNDTIQASQGHKIAYQEEPSYWQLEHETPIHCQRPFELVHIDHTLLDHHPISIVSGKPRTRVWLTLVMDAFSRRILGYWLTYRPPSTFSVLMALYDMFKRFGRIPDTVITDWGSDFRSKALKLAMNALGIRHLFRPKSAARYGAVLERVFGVVHTRLLHNLAGNTKATKLVRTMTRSVDPKQHAGLFLYQIYDGLEEFFFSIYDSQAHPAWLRPPRDVFNDGMISGGKRTHQLIDVNDCLHLLLPDARGGTRMIDDRRGIRVNYERYGSLALTDRTLRGRPVPVKLVPFDPGCVLAHVDGKWVYCRSKFTGDFANVPPSYLRAVYEDLLMDHRFVAAAREKSSEELTDLIERLNAAALANKEFMDDPEVRKKLAYAFSLPPSADTKSADGASEENEHQRIAAMAAQALQAAAQTTYGEVLR